MGRRRKDPGDRLDREDERDLRQGQSGLFICRQEEYHRGDIDERPARPRFEYGYNHIQCQLVKEVVGADDGPQGKVRDQVGVFRGDVGDWCGREEYEQCYRRDNTTGGIRAQRRYDSQR